MNLIADELTLPQPPDDARVHQLSQLCELPSSDAELGFCKALLFPQLSNGRCCLVSSIHYPYLFDLASRWLFAALG